MNKSSISTFIFLGFCLNIFLLIFLPDGSNTVNLIIRLSGVIGLSWLIYFYFQYLGIESSPNHKKNNFAYQLIDIDNSDKDSAFVQGDETPFSNGQRVIIIYGNDVRILPFQE